MNDPISMSEKWRTLWQGVNAHQNDQHQCNNFSHHEKILQTRSNFHAVTVDPRKTTDKNRG